MSRRSLGEGGSPKENVSMAWKEPAERHSDELIEAIGRAAHHIAFTLKEGFAHMANAETQALADLSAAVTAIGTAVTAEIAALMAALGSAGVNNSPAIEASVASLNQLASQLTASLPVVKATPAPTVTGMVPSSGPVAGGTTVTLTGIAFTGDTGVKVGGVAATGVVVVSDTSMTFITPAMPAGAVPVVVTTPAGSNDNSTLFTFS
jgi:hypothetical protein